MTIGDDQNDWIDVYVDMMKKSGDRPGIKELVNIVEKARPQKKPQVPNPSKAFMEYWLEKDAKKHLPTKKPKARGRPKAEVFIDEFDDFHNQETERDIEDAREEAMRVAEQAKMEWDTSPTKDDFTKKIEEILNNGFPGFMFFVTKVMGKNDRRMIIVDGVETAAIPPRKRNWKVTIPSASIGNNEQLMHDILFKISTDMAEQIEQKRTSA